VTARTEHQLVIFTLHGEPYGLPIELVAEIIRYTPPTATAAATELIRGLINLRGRVLPVVDLSVRLGRERAIAAGTRILVLELKRGALGLIVDGVDGIVTIGSEQIKPLPVPSEGDGLADSIAVVGDGLVLLLDAERALGAALPPPPPPRRRRAPRARPAGESA
jgi:purine-binding chemotaxis protein CheW